MGSPKAVPHGAAEPARLRPNLFALLAKPLRLCHMLGKLRQVESSALPGSSTFSRTPRSRGRLQIKQNSALLKTSWASGELPADTPRYGTTSSTIRNRTPGELPAGVKNCGTMGLPKARRGHDIMLGPAPTDSPPSHRPGGAAGLPAPLTPHIRRALDVSTSGQVALLSSEASRPPRRHGDTAERWASPKLDADTTQCSAWYQRTPRHHTSLAEQRDSPRRSRRTYDELTTSQRRNKSRPQLPQLFQLPQLPQLPQLSQLPQLPKLLQLPQLLPLMNASPAIFFCRRSDASIKNLV